MHWMDPGLAHGLVGVEQNRDDNAGLPLVVKSPGWIAMSADAHARCGDGNIELHGVVWWRGAC